MDHCTENLDFRNGGSMGTELRNILRASMLYPPSNDEKIERSPGASGQKLQAPRQLYSSASLQHPPKWPIECQVVPEKVSHFNIVPSIPEPFYVSTNSEPQPRPVGEEMGTVIYDYQPKLCVDYYCRSSYGGSDELTSYDFDDTTLKFESRFEAGNLAKVIKVTNVYYELYLRPDMYTDRHAQWYYFRIRNTRENIVYRFSIVNLSKPDSLYRLGMKPLLYSEKDAQINGIGWIRCGYNISYYKNDITANDNTSSFTLTFNLKFQYSNDTVYIAQCYPYTYSNLQLYLQEIQADRNRAQLCQQRLLCKSLAGNNVYVLTITAPEGQDEEQVKKPAIVLTARVHPGETPSSYMMKGVIDFLTSDSPHAEKLRNRFIFKLIPMLNPDGVIVGNSRCCLLGQDLNRQYRTVLREAFPQIYQKKVLLRRLVDENGIFLYCDIHGHSRRNNVFMYGCENRRIAEKKLTEQVFPLMMHKNAADKFSFSSCKFRIQKSKEGTGRIFVWTLGVTNSYTLEISLCGSTLVSREHTHFNFVDYEDIGRHFCETLLDYSDTATIKEKIRQKILNKLKIGGSTAEEPINIPISDYSSLSHSDSDNESDTTEDDDEQDIVKAKNSVARQASLRNLRNQQAKSKLERKSSGVATKTTEVGSNEKRSRSLGKAAITRGERNTSKYVSIRQTSAKGRQIGTGPAMGAGSLLNSIVTAPKYTNLIFEDPFRPPGIVIMNTSPEETVDTGTQTEDECDCKDAKLRNDIYLKCPSRTTMNALTRSFVSMNLLPRPNRCKLRSRSSSDASSQLETSSKGSSTKLSRLKLLDSSSPASERRRDSLPTPTHSLAAKTGTYKIQNSASQDELVQQKSHLNQHEPLASLKHTSFIRQSAMINLIKREPKHHQPISSRRVSWGGQANFSVTTRRNSVQLETSVRKKSKTGLTRERKALLTDTSASGIGVLLQPTKTEQQWRRSKASKFRN